MLTPCSDMHRRRPVWANVAWHNLCHLSLLPARPGGSEGPADPASQAFRFDPPIAQVLRHSRPRSIGCHVAAKASRRPLRSCRLGSAREGPCAGTRPRALRIRLLQLWGDGRAEWLAGGWAIGGRAPAGGAWISREIDQLRIDG